VVIVARGCGHLSSTRIFCPTVELVKRITKLCIMLYLEEVKTFLRDKTQSHIGTGHLPVAVYVSYVFLQNKSKTVEARVTKFDTHDDLETPWSRIYFGSKRLH